MTNRYALPLALALLVGGASHLSGQSAALGAPIAARIDSVFRRFTAPGSPGCALGVVRDGSMVYSKGYGLASVELSVPITPATVFDIGSVSKQFTAMSVLLLVQDGKLSLDDEIQRLIPEIPRYARPITIRHLLHHTSGLRDYIDILGWSGISDEAVTTDQDALDAIVRQKATNFEPGAEFLYSNSGFFLLSVIVKRASGESLREFAAKRIFQRLGMSHTQFIDRHDMIVAGKAGSYADGDRGGFVLALANWEQTGDGAVNTTVEDLVKWNENFDSGRVGGQGALGELLTPGVLTNGSPITYALGINVGTYRGVRQISHGGAWAGFRAHFERFPEQRLAIFTLCNLGSAGPGLLSDRVADILLADRLGPVTMRSGPPRSELRPSSASSVPEGIAGRYHSDELIADWRVFQRGDSVILRVGTGPDVVMRPAAPDTLTVFGTRIAVLREAGRVSGLSINTRGLRGLRLSRISDAQ